MQAQPSMLSLHGKIASEVIAMCSDGAGHLLLVKSGVIEKYRISSASVVGSFSFWSAGEVSGVDAKNRFKILVFSEQHQQIYYMDNRLTSLSEQLNLSSLGESQVTALCASYDDGFWLYDPLQTCLKRLDREGNVRNVTETLSLLTDSGTFQPVQLLETQSRLVALDTNYGLLFFDLFGNFIRPYPIRDCRFMTVSGDMFVLLVGDELCAFSGPEWKQLFKIATPLPHPKAVLAEGNHLFLLDREGELYHYRWSGRQ